MILKLMGSMGGDFYYSKDGDEYELVGSQPIQVDSLIMVCARGETTLGGHGGSWSVETHKWINTSSGDDETKRFKRGIEISGDLLKNRFNKVGKNTQILWDGI